MAGFRITQRTMSTNVVTNLQRGLDKMSTLQEKLASGQQIQRPSDSPTGTVSALRFRADLRRLDQLDRNAQDGLGWLGTADTALTQTLGVVNRVRELTLIGANATSGPIEREALAAEIDALRTAAISLANTTWIDRPIFAGTADAGAAYDADGVYQGDDGAVVRAVAPGADVQVNRVGPSVFGPLEPGGDDLFAVLARISDDLRNAPANLTGATGDLVDLDALTRSIQNQLATVGARYNQVETMKDRVQGTIDERKAALAEVESIDLPSTIVELQMQEVAYQAALGATAKVIQPSLLDFLR